MIQPADSDVRRRALDPAASFIVQAPAGSGKTELLIRRFLTLLAHVGQPEEIVAITFTRKAAAEMRSRIVAALDLAAQAEPDDEFQRGLWRVAQPAWRNNRALGWQLHRHPARLRIQTVDALCASLARRMPWSSGLGPAQTLVEDATALYREAALRTVALVAEDDEEWAQAASVLLLHVDNRVSRAVDLLSGMLRHRDQWLRHVVDASHSEQRLSRDALETAWARLAQRVLTSAQAAVPAELSRDLLLCARYAAAHVAKIDAGSPIGLWRERRAFPGVDRDDVAVWRGLAELLLRRDDRWRRSVNRSTGFPALKNARASTMRARMIGLLQSLSQEEHFRRALRDVRALPDPVFSGVQWRTLKAITRLLPLVAAQLDVLFEERACVDFPELNRRANLALGETDDPTELALLEDQRIQHLLVDEFQDTSLSQFELLQGLTAGWQADDGRTLFLVGDPMQSIYRFRQAEVGLFGQVVRHGLAGVAMEPLKLRVNFRSDPALVEWVNGCFGRRPQPVDDVLTGTVEFAPSESFVAHAGGADVHVHLSSSAHGDGGEASKVVSIVEGRLQKRPNTSVGILARSRSHLQDIVPALQQAGIPYAGVEIDGLMHQPVVQDLLTLTRALQTPADRTAWLAVLRAPWCGLGLGALWSLVSPNPEDCIWDRMQSDDVQQRLDADGRRRLARVVEVMRESLSHRNRGDPGWQVRWTWERLGGPACVTEDALSHADAFFDLLGEHARGGGIVKLSEFLRVLHDTWIGPEAGSGAPLQLMTLHKAKGLEFDTVIIPGLDRVPRREEAKLLLWEEDPAQMDENLLLATSPGIGAAPDRHYEYLSQLRARKDLLETERLLYVGCTRARRHLHLLGTLPVGAGGRVRSPRAGSFLDKLWDRIETPGDDGVGSCAGGDTGVAQAGVRRLHRLPADWSPPDPAAFAARDRSPPLAEESAHVEFAWAGETARIVGTLAHEFLYRLGIEGVSLLRAIDPQAQRLLWRNNLIACGVSGEDLDAALERLGLLLQNLDQDSRVQWLFDPAHGDVHIEYGVSGVADGRLRQLRIDRTFVDRHGVRWIVDFKNSLHEGGGLEEFLAREVDRYRPQLEAYARMLRAMEGRSIRLGLYFPLLKRWREWAYA